MKKSRKWLITGVAGFIGSNLLETLLKLDQQVVGLDNFSTGHKHNLEDVKNNVSEEQWSGFTLIEDDIRNLKACRQACRRVNYILHQAALCSVEQSIHDPLLTSTNNINGFLNMLAAACETGVDRFIYASSCAVYGDCKKLPLDEYQKGNFLSPYAANKFINELHGELFSRIYNLNTVGLRYFNIFGPRQDSNSPYSGVIARWLFSLMRNDKAYIYGDGETTRDFCYVEDCVQANLLAACTQNTNALNKIYNIGTGKSTDLNKLYKLTKTAVSKVNHKVKDQNPIYKDFRSGDIRHSISDISRAGELLGYQPKYSLQDGLDLTAAWYFKNQKMGSSPI